MLDELDKVNTEKYLGFIILYQGSIQGNGTNKTFTMDKLLFSLFLIWQSRKPQQCLSEAELIYEEIIITSSLQIASTLGTGHLKT